MESTQHRISVCFSGFFFPDRFLFHANLGSTCQLNSIFGHFWPMTVPLCLNFAKVCFNFSAAVFLLLVTQGIFRCKNDLGCFSFSFQQRIRQASERKVSTESDQFSFKEEKREAECNILRQMCVSGKSWRGDATKEICVLLIR